MEMGCSASKDVQDVTKLLSYIDDGKTTAVSSALDKPEDVENFPVFPDGTKSLLSKVLTKQIWFSLKD